MRDIKDLEDIKLLVDTFYKKARADKFVGPIFEKYLANKWDAHHEILYRFWQTVVLKEMAYYGQPVPIHFNMGIGREHFDRWLELWLESVNGLFQGPKAERAKLRGKTMGDAFVNKIEKHHNKKS